MGTTQDRAGVGRIILAEALTMLQLDAREGLPHARNGQPIAPSSDYVAQLRRDMKIGKAVPWNMVLEVAECDLRDGVSLSVVGAPFRQALAHLAEIAKRIEKKLDRPLMVLMLNETRAQGKADVAQFRAAEPTRSVAVLEAAVRDVAEHRDSLNAVIDGLERELAIARNAETPMRHAAPRARMAVLS